MNKPSRKWNNTRRAVLERVQRNAIEPLEPLFTIYAAVCIFYLVGFLRFQFFVDITAFSWIDTVQLLSVAIAGVLVPILTGSVLTLHFASRRLDRLASE
jgi:hypothetical protein